VASRKRTGTGAASGTATRARAGQTPRPLKRKSCMLCKDKVAEVDYKNVNLLRRYLSDRGKIRNRRMTGACRRHQRQVALAIKRAREMALLPYSAVTALSASKGSGGERRDRNGRTA
jgi:small subunit ribosomal protein S18